MEINILKDAVDLVAIEYPSEITNIRILDLTNLIQAEVAFREEFDFISNFSNVYLIMLDNIKPKSRCRCIYLDFKNKVITVECEIPEK